MTSPKKPRGRPPKAAEERADLIVHVRFTADEVATIDAFAAKKREELGAFAGSITRSTVIRALVLDGIAAPKRSRR